MTWRSGRRRRPSPTGWSGWRSRVRRVRGQQAVANPCRHGRPSGPGYALRLEARSRLDTAFVTRTYLRGIAGSSFGVRAYAEAGWCGVRALVALLRLEARNDVRPVTG